MDYRVLISFIFMTLMDIYFCNPSRAVMSCEKKAAGKLYPVVPSSCKYYYSCQQSQNRGLVPIPYACPRNLLFDFKIQTCVVGNAKYQCREEDYDVSCEPKCDCKLCYCHENLCSSDCYEYEKRWCGGRSSRSLKISSLRKGSDGRIPILINATFDCSDKYAGVYYSDPQFDCRVFHSCVQKRLGGPLLLKSNLCPGETAFDQIKLSCRPMGSFDCESVTNWYFLRSSSSGKPSVPAKIASINRISIENKRNFSFTDVAHSPIDSPKSTETPTTTTIISSGVSGIPFNSTIPLISIINPSSQQGLKGQLATCSYYQCCPEVCPPCHEICSRGTCIDNWCQNYYELSGEDLSTYIGQEVINLKDHILYFGETFPGTEDLSVRSPSVHRRDTCEDKVHGGIYANMTSGCKSFYACINDATRENLIKHATDCQKGTYFNQKTHDCVWKLNFPCLESYLYF